MSYKITITEQDINDMVRSVIREYRERKSYRREEDQPFIERMNQFAEKYGYEPFTYARRQGNPEDYAQQLIRRHNTYLRGVSTDRLTDDAKEYAVAALRKQGIQNPTMSQIMQFAATHPRPEYRSFFVSTGGNPLVYSDGYMGGKNGGVAKVSRRYNLGNDRMKWFDVGEGDYDMKTNDEYDDDTFYGSGVLKMNANIGDNEIGNPWDKQCGDGSEQLIGGSAEFGGWLTDDELNKSKGLTKKDLKRKAYLGRKRSLGQRLSKREEGSEDFKNHFGNQREKSFDTFLTSRKPKNY